MSKMDSFLSMFKGPSNTYDTARILFAVGGLTGIFTPVGFQSYALWEGQRFDVFAFFFISHASYPVYPCFYAFPVRN